MTPSNMLLLLCYLTKHLLHGILNLLINMPLQIQLKLRGHLFVIFHGHRLRNWSPLFRGDINPFLNNHAKIL